MSKSHKQFLFTSIGIALSFLIALSGWRLTIELLGIKERALLSATGTVHVEGNHNQGTTLQFPVLTEAEMFKVLQNWESDGTEQPHEPVDGQLNIEQAINAGRVGISYFIEQGIIPAELFEYDKTNAYLGDKKFSMQDQALSPYYSYWKITFSSETGSVALTINAMTGQIWEAVVSGIGTDEIEIEKVLDAFVSYLDLGDSGLYKADKTTASRSFSGGMLHAVAISRIKTISTIDNEDDFPEPLHIHMYLTTQAPIIE